ncbi:hypothetical protein BDN72DRAFT_905840 [Pluteus cervinus]|uniref:Uncharacterized protein n=1 Tax=Pluteus cervinus TaxID=181527 RepID=A0ACD3A175_9AGAR|nr:hypothetical protein BDN72DRAFT_905840 [Pluteus cervinus]
MLELREKLAEMGMSLNDDSFNTYIQTSLYESPSYNPVLTALNANTRINQWKLTTAILVSSLFDEADIRQSKKAVDKLAKNAAMAINKRKGKRKEKDNKKNDKKNDKYCTNCKRDGHVKEACFAKGGGKEGSAPDWWKKKIGDSSSTNVTDRKDEKQDYAFLAGSDDVDDVSLNHLRHPIRKCKYVLKTLLLTW